ncbi:PVC-type heme-binding CxxCH protein [Allorhodopirellula solitaria]|nr:PVC-type heme-binding CxxCH protein [Allorhodopirellula solitaria]
MIPPAAVLRLTLLFLSGLPLPSLRAADDALAATGDRLPGAAQPGSPASWYGAGVRPTEPRTPSDEQAGFHLAPGFEIRLFAAEPQIAKPMNMAFDDQGRVWVTNSVEYPFPAPDGTTPSDSVRILEDTDGDGHADESVVFADGLNIPIGVLPYGDGCLCYSIPNIYYLRDTDEDGVCDQREVILGPFDTTRDTHGMINSMRMGDDGWVYANHGFNNQSTVAGSDGHEIVMHSGNTFRFRPDGSRVEHITWGQVNPFGRTSDDWGNDFTADCHSKPISQMVRGGQYPGFGRLDDGLGMIPPMMDHLHGSTAISGLVFFSEESPMPSLANQMLSGNVMTSRINRNAVSYQGATAVAEELPDFLTSDDPWFRPVDIRLGPDGYLYVADFYNRIIGHYEVPLNHPGRDRFRGRIWQIRALDAKQEGAGSSTGPKAVERSWGSTNATHRRLALQVAAEHPSEMLDQRARELVTNPEAGTTNARITAAWYLQQRGQLDRQLLERLSNDASAKVRTHGCRAIAAILHQQSSVADPSPPCFDLALAKLEDNNAHVRSAAAEALGQSTRTEAIVPLLELLARVGPEDVIGRQTVRIAIRDIVQSQPDFDSSLEGLTATMPRAQRREFAEIMPAVPTPVAADALISLLDHEETLPSRADAMIQHIVTRASSDRFDAVIGLAKRYAADRTDAGFDLAQSLADACKQRGKPIPPRLRDWIDEQIESDLEQLRSRLASGRPLAIRWQDEHGARWPAQARPSADTGQPVEMFSSFPLGESYTGKLVSSPFVCPPQISFRLAGHNRHPERVDSGLNRIELVASKTGQVLQTALPPRQDPAVLTQWDCRSIQGSSVFLRCIDGDAGAAYAWIAVGALTPAWLSETDQTLERVLSALTRYQIRDRRADLVELHTVLDEDPLQRVRIVAAIAELDQNHAVARLLTRASELSIIRPVVDDWSLLAIEGETIDELKPTATLAKQLTTAQQAQLAISLASDAETVSILVKLSEDGALAPEILLEKSVWEPLQTTADASLLERAKATREQAPPMDAAIEAEMIAIGQRSAHVKADMESGRSRFVKHCALCHQLGGQGELVGPQLDGLGSRSAQRLIEDIMVPDRNVDKAFRTTTFLTVDGSVINGLVKDEDSSRVLVVGVDGKTQKIPLDRIELRRESSTSLMPSGLHKAIGSEGIAEIVQYLQYAATQRAEPE